MGDSRKKRQQLESEECGIEIEEQRSAVYKD